MNFSFYGLRKTEAGYVLFRYMTIYDGMVEWVR